MPIRHPRLHPTYTIPTPLLIITDPGVISSKRPQPTLSSMLSFEKLPSELHYCIADYLPPQCLDVLNRTNRHLHSIYEHFIYFRAISRTRAIKTKRYKAGRLYPIPVRLGKLGSVQQIARFCDLYEEACHGGSCNCDYCCGFEFSKKERDSHEPKDYQPPLEAECVQLAILMSACNIGLSRKDAVEYLAKRLGSRMNTWYWSPMRAILHTPWDNFQFPGAANRHLLIPTLVANGLDVNFPVSTKINRRREYGLSEEHEREWKVDRLMERVNAVHTPTVIAVCHERYDLLELLLANRGDVNRPNTVGLTPLNIAFLLLVARDRQMMEFLLDHGADVNCKPLPLTTQLYYNMKTEYNFGKLLSMLLDRGLDVGQYGRQQPTVEAVDVLYGGMNGGPLEWVLDEERTVGFSWTGRVDLFIRLLKAGANTEVIDEKGNTALIRVLETRINALDRAATALIEHGANIYAKNEQTGRTPIKVAAALRKEWALNAMFPDDNTLVEKWLNDEEFQQSQGLTWDLKNDIQRY